MRAPSIFPCVSPPHPFDSPPLPPLRTSVGRLERTLLSRVEYFDDFCLTHEDERYMQEHYDIKPEDRANYFVRTYPQR